MACQIERVETLSLTLLPLRLSTGKFRGSPATTSSVDDHLDLVDKSIPSYLVVDRRVQETSLAVLCLDVATLHRQSRLPRLFKTYLGS